MRITYITTTNGRNVGDEFIRHGLIEVMKSAVGDHHAYFIDKHDQISRYRKHAREPDALSDKLLDADIVVQAGAPVYWNHSGSSYDIDWYKWLWEDGIFRIGQTKPVLNLGAGSCQRTVSDIESMLSDDRLVEFATIAASACRLTTCRDPLAASFLRAIDVEASLVECPAFLASIKKPVRPPSGGFVVNLMPMAGHHVIKEQDTYRWQQQAKIMVRELREKYGPLTFSAHDAEEMGFSAKLATEHDRLFWSAEYGEYQKLYEQCSGIFANRVHAAVCAAGYGRPAFIVGNDSRIGIAQPIGIDHWDVNDFQTRPALDAIAKAMDPDNHAAEQNRLIELRDQSFERQVALVREALGR